MNNKYFTILPILLLTFFSKTAFSSDTILRISARNSFKAFENKMEAENNDITNCLTEFRKAVVDLEAFITDDPCAYKEKEQLLTIVNALYDIGDTFMAGGKKIEEQYPDKASLYCSKAATCYSELASIYPDRTELTEKSNNAHQLSALFCLQGRILELDRTIGLRLDRSLYILDKIDIAYKKLGKWEHIQKGTHPLILMSVSKLESALSKIFNNALKSKDPTKAFYSYNGMVRASKVLPTIERNQRIENFADSLAGVFGNHINKIEQYRKDADTKFEENDFEAAIKHYESLTYTIKSMPKVVITGTELDKRLNAMVTKANLQGLLKYANVKIPHAKLQLFIAKGKEALEDKQYLLAYDSVNSAFKYDPLCPEAKSLLDKVLRAIKGLRKDEINSFRLAVLYYDPIPLSNWIEAASKGVFNKGYVNVRGIIRQQLNNTVFIEHGGSIIAIILSNIRLLREGEGIVAVAYYEKLSVFETVLGVQKQIPVFSVRYIE